MAGERATMAESLPAPHWLGIDFGTSGVRAIAITADHHIRAQVECPLQSQQPAHWRLALEQVIQALPRAVRQGVQAIALNGTSSTVLLCDATGQPLGDPLLYHDGRGKIGLQALAAIAPADSPVLSATSSLAKLLWWQRQGPFSAQAPPFFLHQSDWLAFLLHGELGISDYHNALKLGYDVEALCYPDWVQNLAMPFILPQVRVPGAAIAPLTAAAAAHFDLPLTCQVCAGTTDSIAAFLASGARQPGEAVTSLGSTLVLKLLSQTRVDEAASGIYSHRFQDLWLVGGASNTGGAVLREFFKDAELEQYSRQIDPTMPSPLAYYPLQKPGERFPINDPDWPPQLQPRPQDPVAFLQGLLEGIARIEAMGYQRLQALGASPLQRVYTAGGGASNPVWQEMRSRLLAVPVLVSPQRQAAFGSALLALHGLGDP